MPPKFSILIPTFNSAKTIEVSIQSIINQSYENFEIIVQDGHSTDNTLDLIKKINDRRIRIYSEKDNGVYDAMNKALVKTMGEWIYFLGSDDYLKDNGILQELNDCILKFKICNFLYGNVYFKNKQKVYNGSYDRLRLSIESNICHQAIFYKKELFDRLGDYNLSFPLWADWDFNLRCFSYPGLRPYYINKVVAVYNDENGVSSLHDIGKEMFYQFLPLETKGFDTIEKFKKESIDYKVGKKIIDVLRFFRKFGNKITGKLSNKKV